MIPRDVLFILLLAVPLCVLVLYLAATPPTRRAFGVDAAPGNAVFRNFYGIERNAGGAFRWTKPEASLSLPVAAPATYAITLTLQDSVSAPPGRQTTVYINGQVLGRATLTTAPQAVRFVYPFTPSLWSGKTNGTLNVDLQTPGFVPSGDPRVLGALVSAIEIEPLAGNAVSRSGLVGLALLLLVVGYTMLRLCGLAPSVALASCGAAMLGFALLAVSRLSAVLRAVEQQLLHPSLSTIFALAAVGCLLGCYIAVRHLPTVALPAASAPTTLGQGAHRWVWLGLGAITLGGLGLRLYRYDALSLWLDETATLYFARLPWADVLGLHGSYDPHPPLYYALVKAAGAFFPEVTVGRLVSVIAGAATIPVLFALVARLTNRRAALAASLLLAVSPLHVWYSQEARMYSSALLLVALSYLALIAFAQEWRVGWAVCYGIVTLLSLYMSYSSLYALLPQIAIFGLITLRIGRASLALWFAAFGVGLGFLPWIVQAGNYVNALGQERADYLGVSPEKMVDVSLSVFGLKNRGSYFWGVVQTPWERSPAVLIALVLALVLTALVGAVLLARAASIGLLAVGALCFGTIGVAAGISLVNPGFAERTVLAATLGWAILLGCAAFGRLQPGRLDLIARGGLALAIVVSLTTIGAFTRGATKTDYRALAEDAAQATRLGMPVIAEFWLGATINAYQPVVQPADPSISDQADGFWIAYLNDQPGLGQDLRRPGAAVGYERVAHLIRSGILGFDFYLRLDTRPAGASPLAVPSSWAAPWQLPANGRVGGSGVPPSLTLNDAPPATLAAPAATGVLYLLEVDTGEQLDGGEAEIALQCLDGANEPLSTAENGAVNGAASATAAGWRTVRTATICPAGTTSVQVRLSRVQRGAISFRNVRLWQVSPGTTTGNTR